MVPKKIVRFEKTTKSNEFQANTNYKSIYEKSADWRGRKKHQIRFNLINVIEFIIFYIQKRVC